MGIPFNQFVLKSQFEDLPDATIEHAKRSLLDLIGVAAAGSQTELSKIITKHATEHFGSTISKAPILFSNNATGPTGATLANGMMIDSVDAHDGYRPAKGHVGCGLLPAILAFANNTNMQDGKELLTQLVIGYEIGSRAGEALHASVPDYHTSGAWIATTCAAIGARAMQLDEERLRHAIGIAEYHGPRSQMMRVIDHPTMLKDGSGWGAMAGVTAAYLAKEDFTGAPAISIEGADVSDFWSDLGDKWLIGEQYFKPYPVCRWAQPPLMAALALVEKHNIDATDIDHIEVVTFHEAVRLATAAPATTEEAQYSLPFPVASAVVNKGLTPADITGDALNNPAVLRLSKSMKLSEADEYNQHFPARRFAEVELHMKNDDVHKSGPTEANGDPETPLSNEVLSTKFHAYAEPVIGHEKAKRIEAGVADLKNSQNISEFLNLLS